MLEGRAHGENLHVAAAQCDAAGMRTWAVLFAACALGGLLGAWLALAIRKLRVGQRARAHNVRGKRGERNAERVLEAHGYRVCARQLRTSYSIDVDRAAHEVDLVLDFLVEHQGERLVAEVKTGRSAPRFVQAETRRQLLEYQVATGCRRVLLVDPEAETITEVAFPLACAISSSAPPRPVLVAAAIALLALAAVWWRHAQ